ncbi:hypothetical protein SADUNF_Sadunf08G0135600 [Salix dunnii]|uniref:Retrotransposon Copia-like N-terminal domain-containing protein n=1 Tax=Salix dunnii TaxID=1413687 RepID=A0A835N1N2_9ROSI|nr:hypothetical protein SADUNF_Sadunf08G0135600 [Salix dunnii]
MKRKVKCISNFDLYKSRFGNRREETLFRDMAPDPVFPQELPLVHLKDDNYEEWARSFRTALRTRKKFRFIDGIIKQPGEGSEDWEDWWTINSLLVSWIRNTIEPTLRSTISHVEIAHDLWNDIEDRSNITNGPHFQQLKSTSAECKQKGMTIMDYYGKLKKIWDELSNFEQLPMCKCGSAYAFSAQNWRRKERKRRCTYFLWDLMSREEQVKNIACGREEHGEIMALVTQTLLDGREKGSTLCSYYNKHGHKAENCFALKGYPDWWGDRPRGDGRRGIGRGRGSPDVQSSGRGGGRTHRGTHRANATQIGTTMAFTSSAITTAKGEARRCRALVVINGRN